MPASTSESCGSFLLGWSDTVEMWAYAVVGVLSSTTKRVVSFLPVVITMWCTVAYDLHVVILQVSKVIIRGLVVKVVALSLCLEISSLTRLCSGCLFAAVLATKKVTATCGTEAEMPPQPRIVLETARWPQKATSVPGARERLREGLRQRTGTARYTNKGCRFMASISFNFVYSLC